MPIRFLHILILLLLLAAFALRLGHLLAGIFHIDEYISMLAAQMTAQRGAPILPSGLFYHQGLLLSYLAAPFIGLLGFREELARWPSLLAGMLTVAAFYPVARKVFNEPAVGLFALTLAVLDPAMILWSARMRMYALAGLLILLALFFLIRGTLLQPRPLYRLAAVICLVGAITAHSVVVVALPVWAVALGVCLLVGQRQFKVDWYRQKSMAPELALALLLLAVGVAFGIGGQIPFLSPAAAAASSNGGDSGASSGLWGVFSKFLDPGVSWGRVDDFIYIYTSADYWPFLVLGGISLGGALLAVVRGQLTRRDLAALFLGLIFLLTITELGLALTSTWRKTRYLFILCHPAFLLLAADGVGRIFEIVAQFLPSRLITAGLQPSTTASQARFVSSQSPPRLLAFLLPFVALILFWAGPALDVAKGQGTGGYDTAFKWVKTQWQEGDRVMTVHPSAAFLYLGRSDYYATQGTARVLADDESEELVDRYVGSTLIDSPVSLAAALSESARLWFVVDTDRLFSRYEPHFIQQIFAQMNRVHETGSVLVFLSQPYPQPVPAEPLAVVKANFNDLVTLAGYSLDLKTITPDRTVQLGLYWRPQTSQFPKPYKVFVQLRNDQNQTVAQADHFIFEGLLSGAVLGQLKDRHEWLRDTADLTLPENLPAGSYQLFIGLYDPDTFERVPVVADATGENAVLLETISIP